jgi:hypothetical protein
MQKFIGVAILAGALLPTSLMAQDTQDEIINATAIAGRQSLLGEWYGMKADCTPVDWVEIVVVTPPEHGKFEVKSMDSAANYPPTNSRWRCNGKALPAKFIAYMPDENYAGSDKIIYDRILSSGQGSRVRLNINVRQLPKASGAPAGASPSPAQ